jgi:hypothetical protein
MANWEYCILTRLSWGVDTKWYANRIYKHTEHDLPEEVTAPEFRQYNRQIEKLHAARIFPILPAVLNMLGADGWELIDDMNTGMPGGEGLALKRELKRRPAARKPAARKKGRK